METGTLFFADRETVLFGDPHSETVFIQPVDRRDLSSPETELSLLKKQLPKTPFCIAAVPVDDWNRELSPWQAPAIFGREDFAGGAEEPLRFLEERLLPAISEGFPAANRKFFLCGYSLAGLFALWGLYLSDRFAGAAGVSPSVWFPGWTEFAGKQPAKEGLVYLSLGDREERTKNPVLASVGDAVRTQYALLREAGIDCTLEWNPGNHFTEPERRVAAGMVWLAGRVGAAERAP